MGCTDIYLHYIQRYCRVKSLKSCWENKYKPKEATNAENVADEDADEDLFTVQMKKRKSDKRDELQVYLAERTVAPASLKLVGALGWWKVCTTFF